MALAAIATAIPSHGTSLEPTASLEPVSASNPPLLLDDGDAASLRHAINQSLTWLRGQPQEQRLYFGTRVVSVAEQVRLLRRMLDLLSDDPSADVLEARVNAEFELLKSVGDKGRMTVTGYHEPIIDAAETKSAAYYVPIYGVPRDLVAGRRRAYLTRAEIEQGRLGDRAKPIAWARDPIDVFFLEIEGSGTLRFPGNHEMRVGYGATNGRPYRSIAWLLIREGKIAPEAMSMRALREWLNEHPEERQRVLQHNESFVFFRHSNRSPVGSLGVPLTPGRSIATDPQVFPRGSLAFIRSMRPFTLPSGQIGWKPVTRFVLSQDAGGAIRGPGRVDVFWGRGPEAALAASDMKELGELYVVVPKTTRVAEPSSGTAPAVTGTPGALHQAVEALRPARQDLVLRLRR
jgi:membrane-bound lytic murein transglycosylase A